MHAPRFSSLMLGFALAAQLGSAAAFAKPLPSDKCALLPASELQTVLGQSFGDPTTSTAPAPYRNVPPGTDCTYAQRSGSGTVLFRIYVDTSPAIAKETFEKLELFFPAKTTLSHLGNAAYIDKSQAIHVLKGSVRFYISVVPAAKDAQLVTLSAWVIKQL